MYQNVQFNQKKREIMENKIRKRLEYLGKNQTWLAKKTGLKLEYINRLVLNKISDPRISTAYKISRILGCRVEDLWVAV